MFSPQRTFFLAVLRHPIAIITDQFDDCGKAIIEHWLEDKERLFEDLKYMEHSAVVHYEHMAMGDTHGNMSQ
jgi:hypothetical protein